MIAMLAIVYSACKKEGGGDSEKIVINRVSLHNANTTDSVVTMARIGTRIRLDGAGFSTTQAVYANGVKLSINPGYVTENHIIFQIPSDLIFGKDVTEENNRNTIRVVTKYDDYMYNFVIQGAVPVVSGVSHTLPREGETIEIYGTNLRDLNKVIFPGNIILSAEQFQVATDNSKITCIVPPGGTTVGGGIRVEGDNGAANSHNFMNRKEGIFIRDFTNDPNVAGGTDACNLRVYNFGTTNGISGNLSTLLPGSDIGPKNPATYRQVPVTKSDIVVDFASGFDFRTCAAFNSVLATAASTIKGTEAPGSLAIQFDYYIPASWLSGYIKFELINGSSQWRYNYAPWAIGAGHTVPVTMNGGRTLTIPFSVFAGINAEKITTFNDLLRFMVSKGGSIRFVNSTFTDGGGSVYPASSIPGFQFAFGNFRVVPYVKASS